MRSIPLRVRITLLVVASAMVATAVIVILGVTSSIDEDIAVNSLESSWQALDETDDQLAEYATGLQENMRAWGRDGGDEPFDDWEELPGLIRKLYDSAGAYEFTDLTLDGAVSVSGLQRCQTNNTFVDCVGPAGTDELPSWAVAEVERRAEEVSGDVPVVVQGFVVTDARGNPVLVRLETDIFAATEVEITSGAEDVAIVLLPVLLIALGAITWFSVGRALSPVESMTKQLDRIGATSLNQRVVVPDADDELKHLAETMNELLGRLEGASTRQRQFISDASHELRSPITATGATLEVAMADPSSADWGSVSSVLDEENKRLARLVDDLLLLARMDEEVHDRPVSDLPPVDLEEICLVEAERPHRVDVAVRVVAPARVDGKAEMLTLAIRNLVENAARYAESKVVLEVDRSTDQAILTIRDDGPGVPPRYSERIFERFVRLDESRTRNEGGGAGLGLAIARKVAERHGGTLALVESDGGARFDLTLPLTYHERGTR